MSAYSNGPSTDYAVRNPLIEKGARAIVPLMPAPRGDGDAVDAMTLARAVLAAVLPDVRRAVAEEAEGRIKEIRPDVTTLNLRTEEGLSLFARARGMNEAIGILRAIAREVGS